MTNLLLSSLTASMQILFIHILFWDGMLLQSWKTEYNKMASYSKFLHFIQKPLFDCHICMTSIWGSLFWLVSFRDVPFLAFLFTVGGISVLFSGVVNKAHEFSDLVYTKEKGI